MLRSRAGPVGFTSLQPVKVESPQSSAPWHPPALSHGCQRGQGKRAEGAQPRARVPGLGGHADAPRRGFPVLRTAGTAPTLPRSRLRLPAPPAAPIQLRTAGLQTALLV